MHNLIFVYVGIWAVIIGRLVFDEWRARRPSSPKSPTMPLEKGDAIMEHANNIVFLETTGGRTESQSRRLWNFAWPHQVVNDSALDPAEKRAILAAWASDKHAVESLPVLRHFPGTPFAVTLTSIMDAIAELDRLSIANDDDPPPPPRAMRPPAAEIAHTQAA